MLFQPTLGLTLGGGGARGGAHIGVYKVLEEIGYKPDVIVGTSMGGIVAAMIGAGWSYEDMCRFIEDVVFDDLIYLERTGQGLVGTDLLRDELTRQFGDIDLRDLTPRVGLVATDVRARSRVLIEKGPLVEALLATSAVPGLFPPVSWNDHLLVDGGVSDNVPTQATYQLGAERIVAVSLQEKTAEPGLAIKNVGVFNGQIQRVLYWLLSLSKRQEAFDTVIHSTAYSQTLLVNYHLTLFPPDVLIQPDMPGISLFTMEKIPDAIEAGEHAAREAEQQIKKLMSRRLLPHKTNINHFSPLVMAK